jgi:hypothetical protein
VQLAWIVLPSITNDRQEHVSNFRVSLLRFNELLRLETFSDTRFLGSQTHEIEISLLFHNADSPIATQKTAIVGVCARRVVYRKCFWDWLPQFHDILTRKATRGPFHGLRLSLTGIESGEAIGRPAHPASAQATGIGVAVTFHKRLTPDCSAHRRLNTQTVGLRRTEYSTPS